MPATTTAASQPSSVLTFSPEIATKIGVEGAIFLAQLDYWMQRSTNIRDGRAWVYNTLKEWGDQFPFWKKSALHRIIADLVNDGIVSATSTFNASTLDRTKWYSINQDHEVFTGERTQEPPISRNPEMEQESMQKVPISRNPKFENPEMGNVRENSHFPKSGNALPISRKSDTLPENTLTKERETLPSVETPQQKTTSPKPKPKTTSEPFLLWRWWAEKVGLPEKATPAGKDINNAKRLVDQGIDIEKAEKLYAFLASERYWQERGVDLGIMVSQLGKWLSKQSLPKPTKPVLDHRDPRSKELPFG